MKMFTANSFTDPQTGLPLSVAKMRRVFSQSFALRSAPVIFFTVSSTALTIPLQTFSGLNE
jgi:hypothetical protein